MRKGYFAIPDIEPSPKALSTIELKRSGSNIKRTYLAEEARYRKDLDDESVAFVHRCFSPCLSSSVLDSIFFYGPIILCLSLLLGIHDCLLEYYSNLKFSDNLLLISFSLRCSYL